MTSADGTETQWRQPWTYQRKWRHWGDFDGEEKPLDPFSSRGDEVWPETADPFPVVTLLDAWGLKTHL